MRHPISLLYLSIAEGDGDILKWPVESLATGNRPVELKSLQLPSCGLFFFGGLLGDQGMDASELIAQAFGPFLQRAVLFVTGPSATGQNDVLHIHDAAL